MTKAWWRRAAWALTAVWAVIGLAAETQEPARTPADLGRRLASLTDAGPRGARWGVLVQTLATGETVYAANADQLFTPASNTKLFTCALALDRLGGGHRLSTVLRTASKPGPDGVVSGDLLVEGGGDPGVRSPETGRGGLVEAIAAAIAGAGVRRVEGSLVLDSRAFRGAPWGGGWAWDDLDGEWAPQATALSVNDNVLRLWISPGSEGEPARLRLDEETEAPGQPSVLTLVNHLVTVGGKSPPEIYLDRQPGAGRLVVTGVVPAGAAPHGEWISQPSPPEMFGRLLLRALTARGIVFAGGARPLLPEAGATAADTRAVPVLTQVASAPVAEIVKATLKPSQNLYAQLLLLAVGAATEDQPSAAEAALPRARTTEAAGLRALGAFLERARVPAAGVWLEEGAGLSRKNLVSPSAVAALLRFMARHREAAPWRDALPVGGVDGTLKSRFATGPAHGNVRAKTGSLAYVNTLSGYVATASGEPLVFSILADHCVGDGAAERTRAAMDRCVNALAAYAGPPLASRAATSGAAR